MAQTLLHWRASLGWIGSGWRRPRRLSSGKGAPVRPAVALLLVSLLLLGGVHPVASAPEDQDTSTAGSVRMDVRAGFDGSGRVGGWIPLDVQLVNEGAELKAEVQVVVEQPGGR